MSKKADYVYRNSDDTVRVRIYRQEEVTGWDFDVVRKDGTADWSHCSLGALGYFQTKKEAKQAAEELNGTLTPFNNVQTLMEGW